MKRKTRKKRVRMDYFSARDIVSAIPESLRSEVGAAEAFDFPKKRGIYVLVCDGWPVYVGQTKDFLTRVAQHVKHYGERIDSAMFWPVECDDPNVLLDIEAYMISIIDPPENVVRPKARIQPEGPAWKQRKQISLQERYSIALSELRAS